MQFIKQQKNFIIVCILLLTSCEKVIDVDLNSASPKYVIEGVVTDSEGPQQVRITQTKNFDENNDFEGISSAEVTIADDAGNTTLLNYTGNGIYETKAFTGTPGRTYYLTVNVEGESFVAASTMPQPVSYDSLYIQEFSTFSDPIKMPYVRYTDTPGIQNFYRHILYINNLKARSIFIGTDERNEGGLIERALRFFSENEEERIKSGDTIRVEVQSVEEDVYDYFFSLDQTISQNAATPANPVSNISGGALGYFSAHSVQTKTIVVE